MDPAIGSETWRDFRAYLISKEVGLSEQCADSLKPIITMSNQPGGAIRDLVQVRSDTARHALPFRMLVLCLTQSGRH